MATIDSAVLEGGIAGAKPNVKIPKITSIPNIAKGAGSKALSLGLGLPAILYDVMAGDMGESNPITGTHPHERAGPENYGLDYDEPIPALDGWTYREAMNSPEWAAAAEEQDMSVYELLDFVLHNSFVAPKEGPAEPGVFPMETLEEYYGDTPWFEEYKEDVPFGHSAQRAFTKTYQDFIGSPLEKITGGIGALFKNKE